MEPKIPVTAEEDAAWEELYRRILYLNEHESLVTVDEETWKEKYF